jgi:uncharacterized membrane protein YphA (DoxX/SURF4 family)
MKKAIAIEIICFLFIVLFMYAAVSKLIDYQKFTIQIGQSPLLTGFGGSIPWLVITIEILISILLIIPRFRLVALFGSFTLMTMFTAYIVAILNFSPYVPCSCGGILEKLGWTEHLIFNSGFIALALLGIVLLTYQSGKTNSLEQSRMASSQLS